MSSSKKRRGHATRRASVKVHAPVPAQPRRVTLADHLAESAQKPDVMSLTVTAAEYSAKGEHLLAAEGALNPCTRAAGSIRPLIRHKDRSGASITALAYALEQQAKAIRNGDLGNAETMLYAQAQTLDQLFGHLTRLAVFELNGGTAAMLEQYMRLGLKAQSQCRATLETLAAVKNPPVVYARQANIANGPQQVNNGVDPRARENESPQTKLLEQINGQRLDAGTASSASDVDSALEAVGQINGASH